MNYHILRFDEVLSTNIELKKMDAPIGTVAVAKKQTGGYGRGGRSFCSPPDGLYFSIALSAKTISQKLLITPLAAVAVQSVISKHIPCGIKWPNDIVADRKKLCGILSEGTGDKVILGIGVNINSPESYFVSHNLPYAASLFSLTGKKYDSDSILHDILNELLKNKDNLIEEYKKNCITLGKEITVIQGQTSYHAVAVDITEGGELVVIKNNEKIIVNSGEVSIRGSEYV